MKTLEERKEAQKQAAKRWLAKPGNREKHRAAVKRCRNTPAAKEAHRNQQLEYASKNREQERLRAAAWRTNNPEKSRQLDRSQYLKDKAGAMEYNRKYRAAHREAVSLWARNRQARKRAGKGKVSRKFILDLFVVQNGKCSICSVDFAKVPYQIDHIVPLSKGGEHCETNVHLLCPTCNKRKSARDLSEFLAILEAENA